jgi:predicted urease superfamily metal-dependent hydrolase
MKDLYDQHLAEVQRAKRAIQEKAAEVCDMLAAKVEELVDSQFSKIADAAVISRNAYENAARSIRGMEL